MISITITGDSAELVQSELRSLLAGVSIGAVVVATGNSGSPTTEPAPAAPKRQTAAEKKAAEKAAAEAEAAAKAAEPETPAQAEASAQDTKDEVADTKAAEPEAIKFNHDSVRKMLSGYVMAYGMTAAQEDGTKIIEAPKISELADDQKVFAKAIVAIANAIEKNPHKRDFDGDGISKEKADELKPLVQAAKALV